MSFGLLGYTENNSRSLALSNAEVIAFFAANSTITDPTTKVALDTAVTSLKSAGIWSKIKVCHPFYGSTATEQSYNLVDSSQFQVTWYNSPTHSSMGVQGNDATLAYGDPNFEMDGNIASPHSTHFAVYQNRTSGYNGDGDGAAMGGFGIGQAAGGNGGTNIGFLIGNQYRALNDVLYSARMDTTLVAPNEWKGFILNARTSTTYAYTQREGVTVATSAVNVAGITYAMTGGSGQTNLFKRTHFILGINNPSNVQWGSSGTIKKQIDSRYCSNARLSWMSRGDGMTEAEATTYRGIVQTLMTTIGRSI